MTFKRAYIHEYGNGKMEPEFEQVRTVLEERGIVCELFTTKRLARRQLEMDNSTFVVGNHDIMRAVFKWLKIDLRSDSYPVSLHPFLERKFYTTTLGKLMSQGMDGGIQCLFIKPRFESKAFTGFVLEDVSTLFSLSGINRSTEVYCSEVVEWLSEYRVYVMRGQIIGVGHYAGDGNIRLDMKKVELAIDAFENSNEAVAAYGIDFGVLKNGKTALVEWNDGFALGNYSLSAEDYTDLLLSRWEELLLIRDEVED